MKELLRYGDAESRRLLLEKINRAEELECRSRRAMWLTALVSAALVLGLVYASMQTREAVEELARVLQDLATGVGVLSALCLSVMAASWVWYRGTLRRVREECQRFVVGLMAASRKGTIVSAAS